MDSPDNDYGVTEMKFLTKPKWICGLLINCCLFISSSVLAGDPLITRHFSGVWDQLIEI